VLYFTSRLCLFPQDMHSEAMVMTAQTLGLPLKNTVKAFTPPPAAHVRVAADPPATRWLAGTDV
jgi:hypothetical protein